MRFELLSERRQQGMKLTCRLRHLRRAEDQFREEPFSVLNDPLSISASSKAPAPFAGREERELCR
jgi:hypothetical protein